MNGVNKKLFPRLGRAALVALLLISAASVPALAQLGNPPPPSAFTVTIDPGGSVTRGVATVSGTFTAPAEVGTVFVPVVVTQSRGGQAISQVSTVVGPFVADGSTQSWTATLVPDTAFTPGQAQVIAKLDTSDGTGLAAAIATVQLTAN
jgi:Family of unknown function (DUF6299)